MHSARGWFGVANKIENKILIGINFFCKKYKNIYTYLVVVAEIAQKNAI